jgi:flagellar biogenesis protein FliO
MVRALLALAGVCLLAWVVLRMLARRWGPGRFGGKPGTVEVLERVPLDARRALWLVRAGERVLLVGTGDGGAPVLVAELDAASLPARAGTQAVAS